MTSFRLSITVTTLAICLASSCAADSTTASVSKPTTAPTAIQRGVKSASQAEVDAFALGYSLEYAHERSYEFIDAVKQLRDVNDDAVAGQMVNRLTTRGEAVRALEADVLQRASGLIGRLGIAPKAGKWADKTVAGLHKSIDPAPAGISSEELVTEHLSNIIDETGRVQKNMMQMLGYALPDLRAKQGAAALWAFDAGTYDAKVHLWTGDIADVPMLRQDAKHIVTKEPAGTPQYLDDALRAIMPPTGPLPVLKKGSGNLSSLLPGSSIGTAGAALRALPGTLTPYFQGSDLAHELDMQAKACE